MTNEHNILQWNKFIAACPDGIGYIIRKVTTNCHFGQLAMFDGLVVQKVTVEIVNGFVKVHCPGFKDYRAWADVYTSYKSACDVALAIVLAKSKAHARAAAESQAAAVKYLEIHDSLVAAWLDHDKG